MSTRAKWIPKDKLSKIQEFLKAHYKEHTDIELAKMFDITRSSIQRIRCEMQLYRDRTKSYKMHGAICWDCTKACNFVLCEWVANCNYQCQDITPMDVPGYVREFELNEHGALILKCDRFEEEKERENGQRKSSNALHKRRN